jgi:hypothetical protein
MNDIMYEGSFLSAGGNGYRAPSAHQPDVQETTQHYRFEKRHLTRTQERGT